MRVLSLFDGISTGQLALKHSQIKIDKYFACEIDPYAIKITQHNFPRTKQLGNVYDLNESNLPEDIDLLLAGFPCFVADTQVISSKGYVPIQDITVEDLVLTHTGNYEKVLQTNCRLSPTVILKAEGFAATETTLEHPYWTRLRTKTFVNKKPVYTFSEPYWEEVKNLTKNHFIALPILQKEENPRNLSHEDCWLLGRFIADGHIDNKPRKDRANSFNYKIILSIGSDKLVDFQRHVKRKYSQHAHGKSTHRIIFCSKLMVELYQDLGLVNGAINKIIPLELLNLPKHLLQSVIEGYMSGDGCYWGGRFSASSISLKLIQTLSLAIAKVYNLKTTIIHTKKPPTYVIEGRTVNQNDVYSLQYLLDSDRVRKDYSLHDQDYIWLPVKSVTETHTLKAVYNFEVAHDNSYTANNAVVHNCQSFSQLSNQLGLSTASGLLVHELVRIRDIIKPTYFLFENVYMLPSHLRALNELFGCEAIGINSSYFSAQARKRLYWTNLNSDISTLPINNLCFNDIRDFKDTRDLLKGDNVLPGKEKFYLPFPSGNPVGALKSGLVQLGELRLKSSGIRRTPKDKIRIENRVYSDKGKYPCLTSAGLGACVSLDGGQTIRRPNSLEKERLQGLPDNYTSVKGSMSDYRRRVLIGNAWQKDVISHILR